MTRTKTTSYAVRCQPNTTFYTNNRQDVPYEKSRQLEAYFERAWASLHPPYVSSFTLENVREKMNKADAKEVFGAVIDVRGRALPGNRESSDQIVLTSIHNLLGAMFMTKAIDGNQVMLLAGDFREARNRVAARINFNSRATDYKLPIAMFVSRVPTPVENLDNFEGVCFKIAVVR